MVVSVVPDDPNGRYRLFEFPAVLFWSLQKRVFSESQLTGTVNLLIMPDLSAVNNSSILLGRIAAESVAVRPIMWRLRRTAHISVKLTVGGYM